MVRIAQRYRAASQRNSPRPPRRPDARLRSSPAFDPQLPWPPLGGSGHQQRHTQAFDGQQGAEGELPGPDDPVRLRHL